MSQQRGSGSMAATRGPLPPHARVLRKIAARRRWNRAAHGPEGITATPTQVHILTRRELEVLRLVATGATDRRIADRLYLSQRTVSSHVSNILDKLGVPSRKVAVIAAARLGLL